VHDSKKIILTATTLYGLEEVLAEELKALGAAEVVPENGAVKFTANKELLYRANLQCRTAVRILMPLKEFSCRHEQELYREVSAIDWSRYLNSNMTFAIDAIVRKSAINNSMFAAQKCKDAIADQFRSRTGKRPSVNADRPDLRLNLFLANNKAVLSLDSSGETLQHRGYRLEGGKAPLNEVLAAGIVILSGWAGKEPLIDPMCGSGTIVIEAAMLAANIAPGLLRKKYAFQRWMDFDSKLFESIRGELTNARKSAIRGPIFGSDKDGKVLTEAKENARRAGVEKLISFERSRFQDLKRNIKEGTIIMNPPYGERISERDLKQFYSEIGDTLKMNYQGFAAWIFSGNPETAKTVGLRTSKRIKLFNGPIECRLLKYELYTGSRKSKYHDAGGNGG